MTFLEVYAAAGLAVLLLVALVWAASLLLRDASIIDIFWGLGFILCAWIYYSLTPAGPPARKFLVSVLTTIWGLRLSAYILLRNWGKGEDFRYHRWRLDAGEAWWWQSLFKVFLLQGFLLWVISIPLLAGQSGAGSGKLGALDYAGIAIWAVGFCFESVGDWQLARFKSDPANKGKLLTTGLWRYTRHPNYFGDALVWWGFYAFAAAAGALWAIYSPLLMTFLLVRVSGVAMLERSLTDTRPGYQAYTQSTSAFFPWFPKKPRGLGYMDNKENSI